MTGYVGPIETQTLKNAYFRQVLFTGKHTQLVVMCLQPGDEIGNETHAHVDQFFRIEQGEARFLLSEKEEHLVREGDAVVVPAGTYHSVLNTSKTTPLRLYTIYSPPNHPDGTVHKTKTEAEAAEAAERHPLQLSSTSTVECAVQDTCRTSQTRIFRREGLA
jgi:mannose-6-phosphate isomerase-like protein (cupin superfamily)